MGRERRFSLIVLAAGLLALSQALLLTRSVDAPILSSAAALPLLASLLWVALAGWETAAVWRRADNKDGAVDAAVGGRSGLRKLLQRPVLIMAALLLVYCLLLLKGISFYVLTPLFLYACMCWLSAGNWLRNLLWTAVSMAVLLLIFSGLFRLVFP